MLCDSRQRAWSHAINTWSQPPGLVGIVHPVAIGEGSAASNLDSQGLSAVKSSALFPSLLEQAAAHCAALAVGEAAARLLCLSRCCTNCTSAAFGLRCGLARVACDLWQPEAGWPDVTHWSHAAWLASRQPIAAVVLSSHSNHTHFPEKQPTSVVAGGPAGHSTRHECLTG